MGGKLVNKVCLVTGGASGIGLSIVEEYLTEGATIIITDLKSKISEFETSKLNCHSSLYTLNVASEKNWNDVINEIKYEFGRIDVLVNNAGIGGKNRIEETSLELWNNILSVNLTGCFLGMKNVAPLMKKAKKGSIINMSSIYGQRGNGEAAAYHASKAGMIGLTKTAAVEYGDYAIRVNTIHPGIIETPLTNEKLKDITIRESFEKSTLLPRFGNPTDVAKAAVFLGSDDSEFITGLEFNVDGGYTVH